MKVHRRYCGKFYYFPFFLFVYGRTFTNSIYVIHPHHYALALNFHGIKIKKKKKGESTELVTKRIKIFEYTCG